MAKEERCMLLPSEKVCQAIYNGRIEGIAKLDKFFEERLEWMNLAYEEAVKKFSGIKNVCPQTPKVTHKNKRKRKKCNMEEKENETKFVKIKNKSSDQVDNDLPSSPFRVKLSKNQTPNKVKEQVKIYEEKNSKTLLADKTPLLSKNAFVPKPVHKESEQLKTEVVYVTTLSPVLLKSPEKIIKSQPMIIISPLKMPELSQTTENKQRRSTICKSQRLRRSSVVGTLIRASITRPSLRRSTLLLSKIRASMRLNNTPKVKCNLDINQINTPETEQNGDDSDSAPSTHLEEISGFTSKAHVKQANTNEKISCETVKQRESSSEIISRTPSPSHCHNKVLKNHFTNTNSAHRSNKQISLKLGFQRKNWGSRGSAKSSFGFKKVSTTMKSNSKYLNKANGTPNMANSSNRFYFSPNVINLENKNKELLKMQQEQKEKEVLKRKNEILQRQIEERKRKYQERMQRVRELKEEMERKQQEQKEKIEREHELKEKLREENMQREAIKRSQRLKEKNTEYEKKRKQKEEEKIHQQKMRQKELLRLKELRSQEIAAQKEQERIAREKAELQKIKEEEMKRAKVEIQKKTEKEEEKVVQVATEDSKCNGVSDKEIPNQQMNRTFNIAEENKSYTNYSITPERSRVPQPLSNPDNYDITHLRSDESTDDENEPRKQIPAWAQGFNLRSLIINQFNNPPNLDSLFPHFDPPDLCQIFKFKRKRFITRTSSAVWTSPIHSLILESKKRSLSE